MNNTRSSFLASMVLAMAAIIALFLAHPSANAAGLDDLNILTENYPPLNYERNGRVEGISADLLLEMLQNAGSIKSRKDIKIVPWARGYKDAQEKTNTLLFTMVRTPARENLFKWVGPIMTAKTVVIARKDSQISINSQEDLYRYKIGAVRDDVAEQLLIKGGVDPKNIHRTISRMGGQILAKMLTVGRIDLWAYGKISAFWNLREIGRLPGEFKVVYTLKESTRYFALHKDTDIAIVSRLQAALDDIRASGKLKTIVNDYISGY